MPDFGGKASPDVDIRDATRRTSGQRRVDSGAIERGPVAASAGSCTAGPPQPRQNRSNDPPANRGRPPLGGARPSTSINAVHTMMMMMTE
jgi:hypothetical protein